MSWKPARSPSPTMRRRSARTRRSARPTSARRNALTSVPRVRPSLLPGAGLAVVLAVAACGGGSSSGIPAGSLSKLVLQPADVPGFDQFDAGKQVTLDNAAGARKDPERFGRE